MYALHREPWQIQRLGILMEPDLADPREAGGVLNPAAARDGPDGGIIAGAVLVWLFRQPQRVAQRQTYHRHGGRWRRA
jgi:hypothetical protein